MLLSSTLMIMIKKTTKSRTYSLFRLLKWFACELLMHAQRDRPIYILFWRLLWLPHHTTHTLSSFRSWMHTNQNTTTTTSSSNNSCCCNRRKRKVISFFLCIKISLFSYPNSSNSKAGRERSVFISLHVIWIRYLQFAWCHCDCICERNPFDA